MPWHHQRCMLCFGMALLPSGPSPTCTAAIALEQWEPRRHLFQSLDSVWIGQFEITALKVFPSTIFNSKLNNLSIIFWKFKKSTGSNFSLHGQIFTCRNGRKQKAFKKSSFTSLLLSLYNQFCIFQLLPLFRRSQIKISFTLWILGFIWKFLANVSFGIIASTSFHLITELRAQVNSIPL